MDLRTGQPIWTFDWRPYKVKKPGDGKGDKPSIPSDGFSLMKVDEANQVLYFPFMEQLIAVDMNSGQPIWGPKEGKTGRVKDMFVLPEGILILTWKGLQLVDKRTGEFVWDKHIKVKGVDESLLIESQGKFYTVSKGAVMEVNVADLSTRMLTEKIKFSGGEDLTNLEVLDNMLILSSGQNLVGVDRDAGGIAYQQFFKAPGPSLGTIAGNMALATVAAAATINSYNINKHSGTSSGDVSYTVRYHQYTPAVLQSGGSATTSSGDIQYISTKFKDADASGFGLARVDKKTGSVMEKIVIGDRDPIYAVNDLDALIFFKSDKKAVTVKSLK
jgi:hypothetical protein